MKKVTAEQILNSIPEHEYWRDLIEAEVQAVVGKGENSQLVSYIDKRLRMEALKYLTDKRDGKAPLAISHQAQVIVQFIRDSKTPAIQVASKPEI